MQLKPNKPPADPCIVSVLGHGGLTVGDAPCWGPLARVNTKLLDQFMYMGFYDAQRQLRIHAYKHIDTHRYLYIDTHGGLWDYKNAFSSSKVAELETPLRERTRPHFVRAQKNTVQRVCRPSSVQGPEDAA